MPRPRIGIYEKALPAVGDWPARLGAAAETGFDFVEIAIDEDPARLARLDWPPAERAALRRAVADSGVPVHTIILSAHRRHPLGSADATTRDRAQAMFVQAVDLAADIGARVVQLAGYFVFYEPHDPDCRSRFVAGLHHGLGHAAGAGVMCGLETMDGEDVISVDNALDIVTEVASPWLQVYPDVGNLAANGLDAAAQLRRAAGHLVGVHLKDTRPGEYRRVPFGDGIVPFAEVFTALAEIGYPGPFLVEMWNDDAPDATATIVAARTWLQERMATAGLMGTHAL